MNLFLWCKLPDSLNFMNTSIIVNNAKFVLTISLLFINENPPTSLENEEMYAVCLCVDLW